MIHLNSNLFYEICNTINEHNQRQTFITTLFLSDLNSSLIVTATGLEPRTTVLKRTLNHLAKQTK